MYLAQHQGVKDVPVEVTHVRNVQKDTTYTIVSAKSALPSVNNAPMQTLVQNSQTTKVAILYS